MTAVPTQDAIAAELDQLQRRRKSGWRMFFIALGLFVLLLVLLPIIVYVAWKARGRALLRKELAAVQARQEPITTAELTAWYAAPAGERDITQLWAAAIKPFESQPYEADATPLPIVGQSVQVPPPGSPWPEEAAVAAFLDKYRPQLDALYRAAQAKGTVRYARPFEHGFHMLLPEAQQSRAASRALQLEFEHLLRQGEANAAIANLQTRFQLAETLRHEPILISMLVRIAIHTVTLSDTRRLSEELPLSDEQLATLQQQVRALDFQGHLHDAILGERAMAYQAFHLPLGFDPQAVLNQQIVVTSTHDVSRVRRPEDCAKALELMSATLEALEKPLHQALADVEGLDNDLKALAGDSPLTGFRYMYTISLLPATLPCIKATGKTAFFRDATDVQLAIQRYRLQHGQPPQQPTDLVPDFLPQVPPDPFDGQPLRWIQRSDSIRIYSIGEDRIDNGGECDATKWQPDMTIIVPLK